LPDSNTIYLLGFSDQIRPYGQGAPAPLHQPAALRQGDHFVSSHSQRRRVFFRREKAVDSFKHLMKKKRTQGEQKHVALPKKIKF